MPTLQLRPVGANWDADRFAVPPDCAAAVTNVSAADFGLVKSLGTGAAAGQTYVTGTAGLTARHVLWCGDDRTAAYSTTPRQVWWLVGSGGGTVQVDQVGDTGITAGYRTPAAWAAATTGTAANVITSGVLNGNAFVNVGNISAGGSLAYGQIGAAAALTVFVPAANDRFRAARPYRYQVVGLGLYNVGGGYDYRTRVSWTSSSATGWPATWAPAAGNDAGSFDLTGAVGRAVDGGQLGADFMIYSEGSTHVMSYVGGTEIMQQRMVSAMAGTIAPNCWASIDDAHVVLTGDDVVLVTPAGVQSIAQGVVRSQLTFSAPADAVYSWVAYNRQRREVIVAVGNDTGDNSTRAYVWNRTTNRWGRREMNTTHGASGRSYTASQAEPELFLRVDNTQSAYALDWTNGGAYPSETATVRWTRLDLGDSATVKQVRRIWLRLQPTGVTGNNITTATLTVTGYMTLQAATESAASSVTVPVTANRPVQLNVVGRYFDITLTDTSGSQPWTLAGIDVDYDARGRW